MAAYWDDRAMCGAEAPHVNRGEGIAARRYFERVRQMEQLIQGKRALAEALRCRAERVTSQAGSPAVTRSVNPYAMSDLVVRAVAIETEINEDLRALGELRREMMETIERLSSVKHQTVLELRYVDGYAWADVAAAMDCTLSNVHKLRVKALAAMDEVLEELGIRNEE